MLTSIHRHCYTLDLSSHKRTPFSQPPTRYIYKIKSQLKVLFFVSGIRPARNQQKHFTLVWQPCQLYSLMDFIFHHWWLLLQLIIWQHRLNNTNSYFFEIQIFTLALICHSKQKMDLPVTRTSLMGKLNSDSYIFLANRQSVVKVWYSQGPNPGFSCEGPAKVVFYLVNN